MFFFYFFFVAVASACVMVGGVEYLVDGEWLVGVHTVCVVHYFEREAKKVGYPRIQCSLL